MLKPTNGKEVGLPAKRGALEKVLKMLQFHFKNGSKFSSQLADNVGGTYACEPLPHNLSDVFEPSPQTSTTDSVDIANAVRLSTAMETTPDAGLSATFALKRLRRTKADCHAFMRGRQIFMPQRRWRHRNRSLPVTGAIFFLVIAVITEMCCQYAYGSPVSRRAKCAVECYAKCAAAGTPKAVYCNCPLRNVESDSCNLMLNDSNIHSKTLDRIVKADTTYKDVRTIAIHLEPVAEAFIYIFEYSTVSADSSRENWIFGGASSSPQITFSVHDPCRDYQFRTIVVLRATDPRRQFVVFRARPIPVKPPPFVVPIDSVRLDQPVESGDRQSLHISISWHNPTGYTDEDIYGYDSPISYPIRCMTPEENLSQPKVELIEGGARMHLNLPISVLQERCRIYLETRMVPKCVRFDNFELQASIELDCRKFPNLSYCQKEMIPQCTDVVDVWGNEDGGVVVVWQPPHITPPELASRTASAGGRLPRRDPLYYSVNFGVTQLQGGSGPLIVRRIVEAREIRVAGNVTKVELPTIRVDVEYGVQICGIYSAGADPKDPSFNIVPVVPFLCGKCRKEDAKLRSECIECSKLEDPVPINYTNSSTTVSVSDTTSPTPFPILVGVDAAAPAKNGRAFAAPSHHARSENVMDVAPLPAVECAGRECAQRNHSTHFITSNRATLNVWSGQRSSEASSDQSSAEQQQQLLSIDAGNRGGDSGDGASSLSGAESSSSIFADSIEDITSNDSVNMFNPQQHHSKIVSTSRVIPVQASSIARIQAAANNNDDADNGSSEFDGAPTQPLNVDANTESTTVQPTTAGGGASTDVFAASPKLFETTLQAAANFVERTTTTPSSYDHRRYPVGTTRPTSAEHHSSSATGRTVGRRPATAGVATLPVLLPPLLHRTSATTLTHVTVAPTPTVTATTTRKLHGSARIHDNLASAGHFQFPLTAFIDEGKETGADENSSIVRNGLGHALTATSGGSVADENSVVIGRVEFVTVPPTTTALNSLTTATTDGSEATGSVERRLHQTKVSSQPNPPRVYSSKSGGGRAESYLRSQTSKQCRQPNGIVCEYGCLDDYHCECPLSAADRQQLTQCVRGIMCPLVGDLTATYDPAGRVVRFYSKELARMLRNSTQYDKLILEFGELSDGRLLFDGDAVEGSRYSPSSSSSSSLLAAFATGRQYSNDFVGENGDREHAFVGINHVHDDAESLFDGRPFELSVRQRLRTVDRSYGLSICFVNTTAVPIVFDENFMAQRSVGGGVFRQAPVSSYAQTLLSPVEMRTATAEDGKFNLESKNLLSSSSLTLQRVIIFVGPMFFILGMLVFGVTVARRCRRRRLHRYTNASLRYGATTIGDIGSGSCVTTSASIPRPFTNADARDYISATIPPAPSISGPLFSNTTTAGVIPTSHHRFSTILSQNVEGDGGNASSTSQPLFSASLAANGTTSTSMTSDGCIGGGYIDRGAASHHHLVAGGHHMSGNGNVGQPSDSATHRLYHQSVPQHHQQRYLAQTLGGSIYISDGGNAANGSEGAHHNLAGGTAGGSGGVNVLAAASRFYGAPSGTGPTTTQPQRTVHF